MVKYVFIGGKQPSEAVHTDPNGNVTLDESRDPTDAPPICYAFGLQFQLGVPMDVTPDKFKTRDAYDNVIRRIAVNRFFKRFADDVEFEDIPAPKRKPGRPAKVVEAQEEADIE